MSKKTTVMVIDDSYTNRLFFRAVLEELDIEVIEAPGVSKALAILKELTPDVILLDMCMPMLDGIDFLERWQPMEKKIPVIVVSILDDHSQIAKALSLGASDYMMKPVETEELIKRIARYTECEVII
jgi:CheY-like chemotaxis protein